MDNGMKNYAMDRDLTVIWNSNQTQVLHNLSALKALNKLMITYLSSINANRGTAIDFLPQAVAFSIYLGHNHWIVPISVSASDIFFCIHKMPRVRSCDRAQ